VTLLRSLASRPACRSCNVGHVGSRWVTLGHVGSCWVTPKGSEEGSQGVNAKGNAFFTGGVDGPSQLVRLQKDVDGKYPTSILRSGERVEGSNRAYV
jgi:hypothetical protein